MDRRLQQAGMTAAAIYAAAYALRSNTIDLDHFKPSEFGLWWPLLDTGLLLKLDAFREDLGSRVIVSPAKGAMGRFSNESSQHFPKPLIKAIDVMTPDADMWSVYKAARRIGFHGIGLYPHWMPYHGAHLDVRADRSDENPALWSAIKTAAGKQEYVEIERAYS
jgi:hypothetical protein